MMYSPVSHIAESNTNMTNNKTKKTKRGSRPPMTPKGKTNANNNNRMINRCGATRPYTVTVPQAYGSFMPPSRYSIISNNSGVSRIRGHELLGQVSQITINNNICGVFDLNPACWTNSRLSLVARTFEKYRFDKFTVTYYPANPTTMAGNVAIYLEMEAFENITDSVVVALNHQFSGMSSIWQSCGFTYTRPSADPTAYILTAKAGTDMALFSQARVAVVRNSTSTDGLNGFIGIEYDVTFMYPELELGYPGAQFESSQALMTAVVNGAISATPAWTSLGVKLAEIVLAKQLNDVYVSGNVNNYTLPAGTTMFTAWDGTRWGFYLTVQAALAGVGILFSSVVLTSVPIQYYVRKLLAGAV